MLPLIFFSPYFQIFLVAVALWIVPEWLGSFGQRAKLDPHMYDRRSYLVLVICIWFGTLLAVWSAILLPDAAIRVERRQIFFAGIVLMMLGVALRWYAVQSRRRKPNATPADPNGQIVLLKGPYRLVRHPAYSGTILTFLGVGLAFTNTASLLLLMLCVVAGHIYRVHAEERALVASLGAPYEQYMRRTARFIPFLF